MIKPMDRVGWGLEILQDGLRPVVIGGLRNVYGEYWQSKIAGDPRLALNLDAQTCLKTLRDQWNKAFYGSEMASVRSSVETAIQWRNCWAHLRPMDWVDAYNALNCFHGILVAFHATGSTEVARLRDGLFASTPSDPREVQFQRVTLDCNTYRSRNHVHQLQGMTAQGASNQPAIYWSPNDSGLLISADLLAQNLPGIECTLSAWFYYNDTTGGYVRTSLPDYAAHGCLSVSVPLVPPFNGSAYRDVNLWIPHRAFDTLPQAYNHLKLHLFVQDLRDGTTYGTSDPVYFEWDRSPVNRNPYYHSHCVTW